MVPTEGDPAEGNIKQALASNVHVVTAGFVFAAATRETRPAEGDYALEKLKVDVVVKPVVVEQVEEQVTKEVEPPAAAIAASVMKAEDVAEQREGKWRTARVFISSTFKDMHGERDHLTRYVFPELQERCNKLRVHVTPGALFIAGAM